jgi:cobalt-zinc-cadmium efflux system outer membrane protein
MDVGRYVAIVLRSNPSAAGGSGLEAAAEAERRSARLLPDPSFAFHWDRARPAEPALSEGTETAYFVSQVIPWPGAFTAGVTAGDRAADAFRAQADERRWDLAAGARETFARLAAARALRDIAREAEVDARSLRDLVARRAELGEARESDRIKAQVEWLRQESALASAQRQAVATEAVLRMLAVEPLPDPLAIEPPNRAALPALDRDALRTRLSDANPQVRAARAEADRQAALLSSARRARIPDLDAGFFRQNEIDKTATGFSLGVRVPLWNANRGEIARAQAALQIASADAAAARIAISAVLEASLAELETASARVSLLDHELLPAAARSVGLARFAFEEGETSLLDLLDAQRTHREAQREAADAGLALSLALAGAQRLLGPDFDPWRTTP